MKSAVETLNPTRVKLTVEVPVDELKPNLDRAYKQIAEQVQVPGFRRGKVPARIIDQRIGRGVVIEQAVNDGLGDYYGSAVEETGIRPLGRPEVDVTAVPDPKTLEGALSFTAEVDVAPEITLPDYAAFRVEVGSSEVSDEDVDKALDALRGRFGTLKSVERPAAEDDFVSIDLKAVIGDEQVDAADGLSYQVGADTMLDGLDEALTGLSAGEETTFESKLAGGEHEGEQATITVKLVSVKERELPEADDDFAQLASEFDTLEELKGSLREQAGRDRLVEQGVEARDKVLEQLLEAVELPLPEAVIDDQVKQHLERENKADDDEHGTEIRPELEKALRTQLLLDDVLRAEDVKITQAELIEYLVGQSRQYGMDPNQFAQMVDQSGQIPAIAAEVGRRKALTVVLDKATVVDAEGHEIDLAPVLHPEQEQAEANAAAAAVAAASAGPDAEAPTKEPVAVDPASVDI